MPTGHSNSLALRVVLAFGGVALLLALLSAQALQRLHDTEAWLAAGLGLAGIVACVFTARWTLQCIVLPLGPATRAVLAVSAGDLSGRVHVEGGGKLQPLLRSLDEVQERLFTLVNEVRTGTGNIALHAAQVTRDNGALERRTHTQAESLQHTAASMEELTAAVQHNVETAAQAHALVRTAAERAGNGGAAMRDVVETMGSIRESSQGIRDIISVIDGIAFQTNILALNAAVEAARAGEQGRGFAVVAAEVRTLAKRCAEAAQEVKASIAAAVEEVDAGSARVDEAGEAMGAIVPAVQEVAMLFEQIDTACREQSAGIGTINGAVAQIDGITQANAAVVQDAARTAAALHDRASAVAQAVDAFRLGAREHGSTADAVALVRAGCRMLEEEGREALLADINRLDAGRFVHRDLYLMAQRIEDGVFVAHGNNPGRLGTGPEVKDVDGKRFAMEFVRTAREHGEGWVEYKWVHPVNGKVFVKAAYVQRAGDLVLACAVYRP